MFTHNSSKLWVHCPEKAGWPLFSLPAAELFDPGRNSKYSIWSPKVVRFNGYNVSQLVFKRQACRIIVLKSWSFSSVSALCPNILLCHCPSSQPLGPWKLEVKCLLSLFICHFEYRPWPLIGCLVWPLAQFMMSLTVSWPRGRPYPGGPRLRTFWFWQIGSNHGMTKSQKWSFVHNCTCFLDIWFKVKQKLIMNKHEHKKTVQLPYHLLTVQLNLRRTTKTNDCTNKSFHCGNYFL